MEMKAIICPIVNQIWLLPFMHCPYYFVISLTQQLTTFGRCKPSSPVSCHVPQLAYLFANLGNHLNVFP